MIKMTALPPTMGQNATVRTLLTVLTSPFVLGLFGGIGASLFCAILMFSLVLHPPQIGVFDREKLIQEMAKEVASSGSLSEAELTAKLHSYKQFFDQAIKTLTVTKKIILLNRNAVISANVADYTQEIRSLINGLESEASNQHAQRQVRGAGQ